MTRPSSSSTPDPVERERKLERLREAARRAYWDATQGPAHLRAGRYWPDPVDVSSLGVGGIVKDGRVELPSTVSLPEGARVRVIVEAEANGVQPLEHEPVSEESVEADMPWATGKRFAP